MTEMSPAEAVFFAAAALPTAERAAYLDRTCAGRDDLRQRVEQMLAARPLIGDFLEPASADAAPILDDGKTLPPAQADTAPLQAEQVGQIIAGRYALVQKLGEG